MLLNTEKKKLILLNNIYIYIYSNIIVDLYALQSKKYRHLIYQ